MPSICEPYSFPLLALTSDRALLTTAHSHTRLEAQATAVLPQEALRNRVLGCHALRHKGLEIVFPLKAASREQEMLDQSAGPSEVRGFVSEHREEFGSSE